MNYTLQISYRDPAAPAPYFINTNHESEDLGELKRLLETPAFQDAEARIIDEDQNVVVEPATHPHKLTPALQALHNLLEGRDIAPPPTPQG